MKDLMHFFNDLISLRAYNPENLSDFQQFIWRSFPRGDILMVLAIIAL